MKVIVNSKDTNFYIILPTPLILNRLTAVIGIKLIKTLCPPNDLSMEDLIKLIRSVKKYKRKHWHWTIADIHTADGTKIHINL